MEETLKTAFLIFLLAVEGMQGCNDVEYLKNEELLKRLDDMAANEPSLVTPYTIGFSSQGTELRVIKISAAGEDSLVPQVRLVGGVHGNEPPSTHVLVHFAEYLVKSYNAGEPYISWLLNNTRIHILPRLNPDGFNEALEGECSHGVGRKNGNGVDLNQAFPRVSMAYDDMLPHFQPEVEAVMRWSEDERFVLAAGLHAGSLVAVYPLDFPLGDLPDGEKAKTKDDDVFVHLAKTYARSHISMSEGLGCQERAGFPEGIVNGAEWFRLPGSMMDYSYLYAGTMELTLEIFCCKYPAPRLLCHIWEQNKLPLLKLCAESIRGVRGIVTSSGIPLEMATVTVLGRDLVVSTNSKGQFFRVLLPGRYFIQVEMIGMISKVLEVVIPRQHTGFYTWTEVNVDLQPDIPTQPSESTSPQPSQIDQQGSLTPLLATDGSTPSPTEETATSIYDKGGLDPDPDPDGNIYLDDTDKFIINDTSILVRKIISSKSAKSVKISYLLNIFVISFICFVQFM